MGKGETLCLRCGESLLSFSGSDEGSVDHSRAKFLFSLRRKLESLGEFGATFVVEMQIYG